MHKILFKIKMYGKFILWIPQNIEITSTVFKFVQNKYPAYMNEVFTPAENIKTNTRNS